jgi:uncharacterized repeat protein (TIGR03803 family)
MIPMALHRFLRFPPAASCFPSAILLALALCLGMPSRECAASEFEVIKYFTTEDGAHPFSELVQGSDDALYGTTVTGNNETDHDTIFKINPDGSGFTVLKNFDSSTTGANCWGGLLLGSDGALYGTTYYGGTGSVGTVFKMNEDGTGYTVLKNFDATTTGGASYARLLEVDNVLYGTTYVGGNGNAGTIFKLNMDGSGFAVLKHFDNSTTGGHPAAALVLGPDGGLYGTAYHGGSFLFGTIFALKTNGSAFGVLKHLNASTTGAYPNARLLSGTDGALYGSGTEGGSFDAGTLFTLAPNGTGFTVLKSLNTFPEGAIPTAGLIQGSDGKLYGTTLRGGTHDWGTVFEMNPDGTGYRVLKRFDYSTTGGVLFGGLFQDSEGALYGAAAYGGDDEFGTLFRLVPGPNEAPTAVATADHAEVVIPDLVTFDGSASTDPDGDELTYAWILIDIPVESGAELTDPNTAHPTLQPDTPGDYKVELTVTDSLGAQSSPAAVTITATDR